MGKIEELLDKEFYSLVLRSTSGTAAYFAAGHAVNPSMGAQSPPSGRLMVLHRSTPHCPSDFVGETRIYVL